MSLLKSTDRYYRVLSHLPCFLEVQNIPGLLPQFSGTSHHRLSTHVHAVLGVLSLSQVLAEGSVSDPQFWKSRLLQAQKPGCSSGPRISTKQQLCDRHIARFAFPVFGFSQPPKRRWSLNISSAEGLCSPSLLYLPNRPCLSSARASDELVPEPSPVLDRYDHR